MALNPSNNFFVFLGAISTWIQHELWKARQMSLVSTYWLFSTFEASVGCSPPIPAFCPHPVLPPLSRCLFSSLLSPVSLTHPKAIARKGWCCLHNQQPEVSLRCPRAHLPGPWPHGCQPSFNTALSPSSLRFLDT